MKNEQGNEQGKDSALAKLADIKSNNRVAISAVNGLLKGEERQALAKLDPTQQLLVILTKAGFGNVAALSGYALGDDAKKLIDGLDVDLRKAIRTIYRYENGVRVEWNYIEMTLPGNMTARFGFRQLEDGTWTIQLL